MAFKKVLSESVKNPLFEEFATLNPKFASNEEALEFYSRKFGALAEKFGLSESELFQKAESSCEHSDELAEVLSIYQKLQFFRSYL